METNKDTYQEQANNFQYLLQQFENEVDQKTKGLLLCELNQYLKEIKSQTKKENDLIFPLEQKFQQLEEEFLTSLNETHNQNKTQLKRQIQNDFHQKIENAGKYKENLEMRKQDLQDELQQQQLLIEEQEQKEIQQEIIEICQEIQNIESMINYLSILIEQQDKQLDEIGIITEDIFQNTVSAEKELDQASSEQIKYRTKMGFINGAFFGGGFGLIFGGRLGSAIGTFLGGTFGKAVGSIGKKKQE